jgi:hypothetical protein
MALATISVLCDRHYVLAMKHSPMRQEESIRIRPQLLKSTQQLKNSCIYNVNNPPFDHVETLTWWGPECRILAIRFLGNKGPIVISRKKSKMARFD